MTVWHAADLRFELLDDLTFDPVATILVTTPAGPLRIMGEPAVDGSTLVVRGLHVQGGEPNTVGAANLLLLAALLMEGLGFDAIIVEGEVRTSGAGPGRRPKPLRFARKVRAATS